MDSKGYFIYFYACTYLTILEKKHPFSGITNAVKLRSNQQSKIKQECI